MLRASTSSSTSSYKSTSATTSGAMWSANHSFEGRAHARSFLKHLHPSYGSTITAVSSKGSKLQQHPTPLPLLLLLLLLLQNAAASAAGAVLSSLSSAIPCERSERSLVGHPLHIAERTPSVGNSKTGEKSSGGTGSWKAEYVRFDLDADVICISRRSQGKSRYAGFPTHGVRV